MAANGAAASYGDLLMMSLVVLGAVCVAAFVLVRLVGRFLATGRVRGAHLLDVIARLPLEPRRSLYVVEVAGKTLLVGTSEMGLSVLSELDGSAVRARAVARPSFGEFVRAAWSRRRGLGDAAGSERGGGAVAVDPGEATWAAGEAAEGAGGGSVADDRGATAKRAGEPRNGVDRADRVEGAERAARDASRGTDDESEPGGRLP
jgi:flagellar biogenesis protein FliO